MARTQKTKNVRKKSTTATPRKGAVSGMSPVQNLIGGAGFKKLDSQAKSLGFKNVDAYATKILRAHCNIIA